MAFRRNLIDVGYEVTNLGYDISDEAGEAYNKAEGAIFALGKRMRRGRLSRINEPLVESFNRMEEARARGSQITGVEMIAIFALYYFHERFWTRYSFGIEGRKTPAAPGVDLGI